MKSRRDFLKIAGLSAFALGTASALTLATGSKASALPAGTAPAKGSYTNEPDALHAKRWAMVIDTRKFTSPEHFQRVIDACHHAHNVPTIPGNQDVKWIWTDKYAHVFPDDVNAYMPESSCTAISSCCATTAKTRPACACARRRPPSSVKTASW